ncbi:MAG: hypothetical protein ACRD88_05535 [Terriglobia bacterium]
MRLRAGALLLAGILGFLAGGNAQEDFLTPGEVNEIRDKQEPEKRLVLYLDLAQRRLDAIKENTAAAKPAAGRAVQKSLREYTSILEALEVTVEEGREKRAFRDKDMKQAEERESGFLKYLQSLDAEKSPGYDDYRFTLEEALAVTEEVVAEGKKGAFPEVLGREPPRLPAAPPREPRGNPPAGDEEGPPRRNRRAQ